MLVFLFVILAGFFKAIMDTINFHYEQSFFYKFDKKYGNWLNPNRSWKNKYSWFPNSKILTYLISNQLVSITDFWHFVQMLYLFSISIAISLSFSLNLFGFEIPFIGNVFIIHTILSTTFEIFWRVFKIKKK